MKLLLCLFVALVAVLVGVQALPPGFVDEGFGNVGAPTGFIFAPKPDGGHMMLVTSKRGYVYLFPDPDNSAERIEILDISGKVCLTGERGLQSVAITPNFETDRYVYLFYPWAKNGNCGESSENGPVNRLARFKMNADFTIDPNSEEKILETSPLFDDIHNGGDMKFGKDGYLYVSVGDGGDRKSQVSQSRSMLLGSMLRIDADGGIPPDNPFVATPQSNFTSARCFEDGVPPAGAPAGTFCEEIFAYGLRNPFRFAMDPNTPDGVVRIFFNDVGGSAWEETNELFKGGNYGWPIREGPCKLNSLTDCKEVRNLMDPVHWYTHSAQGGAAVGCAFVPNGLWPSEYDDAFLFADFVAGEIYKLEEEPALYCRNCNPPVPGWKRTVFHEWEWPVQLAFGPYLSSQALYYTTRGSGFNNVRRIYYVGGSNLSPEALLSSDKTEGQAGTTITFDASLSTDPNLDPLTYDWDFGDGSAPIVNGPSIVSHQFTSDGEYLVTVTVKDDSDFSDEAYLTVTIGNMPVVTITSPPEGAEFAVGDVFTLRGSAVNGDGTPIPAESLSWEVRQHHNTHYHPFLDATPGDMIILHPAPPPEDFEASTNSYLEIILTATNANGVHGSLSRVVMPKMVTLEYDTEPSGLELILDDYTVRTPVDVVSWENHKLSVRAPDQSPWYFEKWSNNKPQDHNITVPARQETSTYNREDEVSYRFVATYQMGRPPTPEPTGSLPGAPGSAPDDLFPPGQAPASGAGKKAVYSTGVGASLVAMMIVFA